MPTEYRDTGEPSSADSGNASIDPIELDASGNIASEPTGGRKKRRDAGQSRGPRPGEKKEKSSPLDLSSLTGLFVGLHVMLAQVTGAEEFAITDDEGKMFIKAAQNVMRHYSVQTTQKTLDWISFVGVAASIYAPRIAAANFRKRGERQSAGGNRQSDVGNVVHFNGGIHSQNPDDFTGGSAA